MDRLEGRRSGDRRAHRRVFLARRPGFAGAADVFTTVLAKDIFGARKGLRIVGMYRNEYVPFANFPIVTLCFELRNAEPNQTASDAAHGCTGCCAAEGSHNRSGSNKRSDAGNGECADAGDPAECAADDATGCDAGRDSFGRFGIFSVGKIAGALLVRKQERDVVVEKIFRLEPIDDSLGLDVGVSDAEYRFFRHDYPYVGYGLHFRQRRGALFDFELILDFALRCYAGRDVADDTFFFRCLDGAAQRNLTIDSNDLYILR